MFSIQTKQNESNVHFTEQKNRTEPIHQRIGNVYNSWSEKKPRKCNSVIIFVDNMCTKSLFQEISVNYFCNDVNIRACTIILIRDFSVLKILFQML